MHSLAAQAAETEKERKDGVAALTEKVRQVRSRSSGRAS